MKSVLMLIVITITLLGCTDAQRASITSVGSRFHVELYAAGGTLIKEWHSTGAVTNEGSSDGFVFVDAATLKNVEIAGTVIITQE